MSLFRSPSFRLKKREKAQRPPPLEEMVERNEPQTSEAPGSSFLVVPETARSSFFTLPSGMSSRSSLFGRNSTSSQDEKKSSSLFKLPNLSRSSFVLKREREDRKGRSDELLRSTGDTDGCGYVPKSKRSESVSNLLELLVKSDRSAPPAKLNVRQRSRTLSTKSLPGTPDHQRRVFTDIPPLNFPLPSAVRASLETPSKPKAVSVPPRLSLDTMSKVSPIRLPSFNGLSLGPISPSIMSDSMSPTSPMSPTLDEATIVFRGGLHSPSPTIVSATTMSTIQDSLLGDYSLGTSSSESDHDQTFVPREDKAHSFTRPLADLKKRARSDRNPPRLTVTSSGRTSPVEPPSRGEFVHPFASMPELPDVIPSPFRNPLESYFANIPTRPSSRSSVASTSQLSVPTTPVHKLATNPVQTGVSPRSPSPSPSPRKLRPRKIPPAVVTSHFKPSPTRSNTLTVPTDEPPATPSSPSFLVGLAWPRPPLRQIFIDANRPGASWHAVSRTIDERLIDGTGMINTDPCHVVMLAHATPGTRIAESLARPGMGGGRSRRRSGTVMREQQPLTPTAVSALVSFAVRSPPLVST
ncbi:hypothetical protein V565_108090 [Rhizoctonia solani 123E]|uniref:Uncharacterized protein n=1 Tax=Rhizoctonia solani 123E TaxID=1423351 RepID=A0A074SGC6_9AGAM|nr:hypothetical protein V565_108090 [Rhizoctonia solani 123E]